MMWRIVCKPSIEFKRKVGLETGLNDDSHWKKNENQKQQQAVTDRENRFLLRKDKFLKESMQVRLINRNKVADG